ncbi:hypothetical protein AB0O78_34375, partial [Streptomyces griseoviridis]
MAAPICPTSGIGRQPGTVVSRDRSSSARPAPALGCPRRHRCTSTLLSPDTPAGTWKLVPATATSGQ